jgi:hypothetical protein
MMQIEWVLPSGVISLINARDAEEQCGATGPYGKLGRAHKVLETSLLFAALRLMHEATVPFF